MAVCHERLTWVRKLVTNKQQITALSFPPHPSLPLISVSSLCFLVSGAQAAQRQPLFASDAQQHHPQFGPSRSPSAGWSVEHGAGGGLSGGGWRLHGRGGGGGAEPLRPLWRRHGGNGALPATGTAGGGGGGQGEVNVGLDDIKLQLQWWIFDLWGAEQAL